MLLLSPRGRYGSPKKYLIWSELDQKLEANVNGFSNSGVRNHGLNECLMFLDGRSNLQTNSRDSRK